MANFFAQFDDKPASERNFFEQFGDEPEQPRAEAEDATIIDRAKDTAIDLGKGVVSLGESVVGLGDIATFGALGAGLEKLGYDPQRTQEFLSSLQSDERQQESREVAEAEGFIETAKALAVNPAEIVGFVVQSIPGTVGAGAAGGMVAKKIAAAAMTEAKALGLVGNKAKDFIGQRVKEQAGKILTGASAAEGAQAAGSIAEAGRQSGEDWSTYAPAAAASGALTAVIGKAGNKIGAKLGIGDIETDIAGRSAGVSGVGAGKGGMIGRVMGEAVKEAGLEEMPQSAQEQVFQNIATGRPAGEDVADAAAIGAFTGGAMGGGHALLSRRPEDTPTIDDQTRTDAENVNRVMASETVDDALAAATAAAESRPTAESRATEKFTTSPGAAPIKPIPNQVFDAPPPTMRRTGVVDYTPPELSTSPGAAPERADAAESGIPFTPSAPDRFAVETPEQADARLRSQKPAGSLPSLPPDPFVVFPDGTTARRGEVEAEIARLETAGQAEDAANLRARLLGYSGGQPSPTAETQIDQTAPADSITYHDPRLKREAFRAAALDLVRRDMTPGGGIAVVPDLNYKPGESDKPGDVRTIRTSSVHQPWIQSLLADNSISVEKVRAAVEKAVTGQPLGKRQQRVVTAILDQVTGERTAADNLEAARMGRDQARALRARARLEASPDFDPFSDPLGDAGEALEEFAYDDEMTDIGRVLRDLRVEAKALGLSDQSDALMESQRSDEDIAAELADLIAGAKNGRASETGTEAGAPGQTEGIRPEEAGETRVTAEEKRQLIADRRQKKRPTPKSQERRTGDRRQDPETRKRVDDMSPDEMRRALLVDELTGLGNRRAYDESEKLPFQVAIDLDGLKFINDTYGHPAGDKLLAEFGVEVLEATGDGYHISGDEFIIQAVNESAALRIIKEVEARAAEAEIEVRTPAGETVTLTGIGFSYGIGQDIDTADARLRDHKAERERQGLRGKRGESAPDRAVEATPERQPDNPDRPQEEVDQSPAEAGLSDSEPYEFSSSQVALSKADALKVRGAASKLIDKADIDPTDGLEKRPHITVKYGLHTADAADLAPVLAGEGPITATVEGIEIFENDTQDVVVLRVSSPDLVRLNQKISDSLEVTDTHPDYKPHITLGYVKKGAGRKYANAKTGLEGKTLTFGAVEFSGKDGNVTPIALEKSTITPSVKKETDLLGEAPVNEQALADAKREKDAKRNGRRDVPMDAPPGTLFNQGQQDIEDAPSEPVQSESDALLDDIKRLQAESVSSAEQRSGGLDAKVRKLAVMLDDKTRGPEEGYRFTRAMDSKFENERVDAIERARGILSETPAPTASELSRPPRGQRSEPANPTSIASLVDMPLVTKADAEAYIAAHDKFMAANGSGGTHQPRPASWQPLSVSNPEIFEKLSRAMELAERNYWQMPYEQAAKMDDFRGLPRAKWEAERKKRGLPVSDDPAYSRKSAEQPRDLLIQHNLTAANLLHAARMGGIPVPSLAVTRKDHPLQNFGEITLLGPAGMADPKGDSGTQVYGSDIYSPRYPSVEYQFTPNMRARVEKMLADGIEATDGRIDWDEIERRGPEEMARTASFMWKFLNDKGIEPTIVRTDVKPLPKQIAKFVKDGVDSFDLNRDPAFADAVYEYWSDELTKAYDGDRNAAESEIAQDRARAAERGVDYFVRDWARQVDEYKRNARNNGQIDGYATRRALANQVREADLTDEINTEAEKLFEDIGPNERIFQGFTYAGKRRYTPHTLENVVKILKKELRGGESAGNVYGVGQLRAKFTPRFRSVEQIRKAKGRLTSKEDFQKVKDEIDAEFFALADALKPYYDSNSDSMRYPDTVMALIEDSARMGLSKAAKEYGFSDISDDARQQMFEFVTRLKTLPTEYFEAKILRGVSLSEFAGAVVPDNVDPVVLAALKDNGITDIRTYKRGDETDRARVIGGFDDLMFSRKPNRAPASSAADLETTLRKPLAALRKLFPVNVVQSVTNLPDNHPADVRGMFANGAVWLVADNLPANEAAEALAHEAVGHLGLEILLGPQMFNDLVKMVQQQKRMGSKRILAIVADLKKNYTDAIGQYALDARQEAREILAHIAEGKADLLTGSPLQKLYQRIKAKIRLWLASKGFGSMEDALIDSLIADAARFVQGEFHIQGFPKQAAMYQRVYHGSPHTFDRFSTDKIGTGEGAQAYGYGLYFAGQKDVAEFYRAKLAGWSRQTSKGVMNAGDFVDALVSMSSAPNKSLEAAVRSKANDAVIEIFEKGRPYQDYVDGLRASRYARMYGSLADAIESLAPSKQAGRLYEVELAPAEDEYLLWDAPLSEQPEKVKQALKRRLPDVGAFDGMDMGGGSVIRDNRDGKYASDMPYPWVLVANGANGASRFGLSQKDVDRMVGRQDDTDLTGQQIYSRFVVNLGGQEAASKALNAAGIPGIKYLDGTSRSKGEGSYNYVIFDENDAKIEAVYSRKAQTETPEFRRWFGDSKVVDADGKPLVVYHWTDNDFAEFDMNMGGEGAHFGTKRAATDRARGMADIGYDIEEEDGKYFVVADSGEKSGEWQGPFSTKKEAISFRAQQPKKIEPMALYLSIKNPIRLPDLGVWSVWDIVRALPDGTLSASEKSAIMDADDRYTKLRETLLEKGIDGIVYRNEVEDKGKDSYIAFRPEQIKSAIGNRGTFDPTDPNIAYSRRAKPEPASPYADLDATLFDELRFKAQDKFHYLSKVQKKAMADRGVQALPEAEDAYLAELRYHGMAGAAIEDFQREHVDPLLEVISKSGLSVDDVDLYLQARHAKEANAQLARINPDREDNEALSGMSNEEAVDILKRLDSPAMRDIADRVDVITQARRDKLVESGLETQDTIDAWEAAYQHYVPLKREGFDGRLPSKGMGFNTRGKEKRRAGSNREVVHVLANVVAQYEATAIKAEKVKVGKAFLEFARNNPNPDLYEVDKVEYKPAFDAEGLVTYREDRGFIMADNVLVVRVDGVDHRITFNQQNPVAMRIAHAMNNLGATESGPIVNALSKLTRWLAIVNTGANPEFVISNFARDLQTAGYNLSATAADKLKWKIIKDVGKSWRGIRSFQKQDGKHHEWAQYFDEFRKAGAQTGWLQSYSSIEDREQALIQKIRDMGQDTTGLKVKVGLKAVIEFIENENTAVENAIRLSAFVHARRAGMTEAQAAKIAKEMTVNFNRKGDMGQVLNALYLFYNASIQGSVRLLQAVAKSRKVQIMAGATIVFAAILDMINRSLGGDDDDGEAKYDKIPDFVKERNLIIMLPSGGGDYIKIPLPWGYNVLHVMGQGVGEALTQRDFRPGKSAMRVAASAVSAFNPIGGSESLLQFLSPTITDPLVQWAENKDWAGKPLRPASNPFGVDTPNSQKYWNSVRAPSKWLTDTLNELTGGDEVRPGAIDISPEAVDLLIDTFTGGAGRFVSDTIATPMKALTGEELETYEVPVLRKVYGAPGMGTVVSDFYERMEAVQVTDKQLKHYKGDGAKIAEIRRQHPGEVRLLMDMKLAQSQLRKVRKQIKLYEKSGNESALKIAREREKEIMRRFNRAYNNKMGRFAEAS